MAQRIDDGVQPTAHTAVQAMIVRAQQVADQTGKAIGVHFDLQEDQVSLVEIGPDVPTDTIFIRVAAPEGGVRIDPPEAVVRGAAETKPGVKAAPI